ncbi:MAG TPA: cytochrome c biogenesis protein CcsA [Gammaproteobacteria bacterium]|nr:cytochrome c biogenesis protein CcsA [Gammaproteobacteria bacterium]
MNTPEPMVNALFPWTAVACYAAATVLIGLRLAGRAVARPLPLLLATAGLAAHAVALVTGIFTAAGLDLGLANTLSLVAWQVTLILLLVTLRQPLETLLLPLLPLAAVSAPLPLYLSATRVLIERRGWQIDAHILLSILAYSLLTVAAFLAVLLAYQEHRLRSHRPGGLMARLPPLTFLEDLLFQFIGAGFALLSLALFSGFAFVHDLFAQHLVHKTVLSVTAWLVFGTLLWGRSRYGWRGRTALRWTLTGFVTLMLAYFGSRFVLEVLLGMRWH